jgi:chromosome segregation ATPase
MSVSGFLDATITFPFRKGNAVNVTDLSAAVTAQQARYEQLQKEVLDLSQERTALALEEQKVNTSRSNGLQELTACRRTCDELVLVKEKLEREVPELEALAEFWRDRNSKSEAALKNAMNQLENLQQQKDTQSFQLLQELQSMYTTLDEATRFLHQQQDGRA